MPFSKSVHQLYDDVPTTRLTGRQRLFCNRVAGGASGAEAARQAGYSAAAAAQQAWRLLSNPKVQAEIERIRDAPELRAQAELDRLLNKVEGVYQSRPRRPVQPGPSRGPVGSPVAGARRAEPAGECNAR